MHIYDKNARNIMDKDGIAYLIVTGYTQLVFQDPVVAINYARTTVQNGNIDVHIYVIRRVDQFTGEVLDDHEAI